MAVVDYRAASEIKNVRTLLEKNDRRKKVTPAEWKNAADRYRALIVYSDDSCRLLSYSPSMLLKKIQESVHVKEKVWQTKQK